MTEVKTEGIILNVVAYQDHHRIFQLFTQELGIISLMAKGVRRPRLQSLLSPLSRIEVVCQKKKGELYFFKEGAMIESHHFLRECWDSLKAAGKMAATLSRTQLPGSPAPKLYELLIACFKSLPHFQSTSQLIMLFYLKLLTHEGVLTWDHPHLFPIPCSLQTWNRLKQLAETHSFQEYAAHKGNEELLPELEKFLYKALA